MSDYSSSRDREDPSGNRYCFKFRCRDCGHKWTRYIITTTPYDVQTPACPNCKKKRKERDGIGQILETGRGPAIGGTNIHNRAIDATAEMVMQDYGLTDLKSPGELRQGESQAPKLPHAMQTAADNMFAPKKALSAVGMDRVAPLVARAALAGSYSAKMTGSPDPISAVQAGQRQADLMARTTILNKDGQ